LKVKAGGTYIYRSAVRRVALDTRLYFWFALSWSVHHHHRSFKV